MPPPTRQSRENLYHLSKVRIFSFPNLELDFHVKKQSTIDQCTNHSGQRKFRSTKDSNLMARTHPVQTHYLHIIRHLVNGIRADMYNGARTRAILRIRIHAMSGCQNMQLMNQDPCAYVRANPGSSNGHQIGQTSISRQNGILRTRPS